MAPSKVIIFLLKDKLEILKEEEYISNTLNLIMDGFNLANILKPSRRRDCYIKVLCIPPTIILGPWAGVELYMYSQLQPGKNNFN